MSHAYRDQHVGKQFTRRKKHKKVKGHESPIVISDDDHLERDGSPSSEASAVLFRI